MLLPNVWLVGLKGIEQETHGFHPQIWESSFPAWFVDEGKVCPRSCQPNCLDSNLAFSCQYPTKIFQIFQMSSVSKLPLPILSPISPCIPDDPSTCIPLKWRRSNSACWSYAKMGRQSTRPPLRTPSWAKKPKGNHGR